MNLNYVKDKKNIFEKSPR